MFKKFGKEDIHSRTALKSSLTRQLRTKVAEQFPALAPHVEDILPKKQQVTIFKCENRVTLYLLASELLFFQRYDENLFPSLRLALKFPECFTKVQVDRGAIKFLLSGANCMSPGLTSPGAWLPEENIEKGTVVLIHSQGKDDACSIGKLEMSTDDIKKINKGMIISFTTADRKGIGVENVHYLGDDLVSSSGRKSNNKWKSRFD